MIRSLSNRFVWRVAVGSTAVAGSGIALWDRLQSLFADLAGQIGEHQAWGAVIAFTTVIGAVLVWLAVPPSAPPSGPSDPIENTSLRRIAAALTVPVFVFIVQWIFWAEIKPYAWFLFLPAVFFSSWLGGLISGLAATTVSTLLVWYVFIPPQFSFYLEAPTAGISIAMFFAMGVLFAVTHQRLRQAEAKSAHDMFRSLLDQSQAAIYIIQDGRFRYVNHAFARMFGYATPDALVNRVRVEDLVAPADRALVRENIRRRVEGEIAEVQYGFQGLRPDGRMFKTEINGRSFSFNGRAAVIGVAVDATERIEAEQARRDSEQRLKQALAASRMGVWELDSTTGALFWSPECQEIFGRNDLDGSIAAFAALLHPDDAAWVIRRMDETVAGKTAFQAEFRIVRPNSVLRWVALQADPVNDEHGRVRRMIGTVQDVTKRKLGEEDLRRQAEDLLRSNDELERFNRSIVGRELDMIALKRQVNELSLLLGRPPPFPLSFLEPSEPVGKTP